MENSITFGNLKIYEINQYSDLINNVFDEFVGKDYSEKGNIEFKKYIEVNNVQERFNSGLYQYYVARNGEEIIGILEIKNKNHISLYFVKKEYHKQGIGKILFEAYKETLIENTNVKIISVNSSIYAEKIYLKLGFIKTNEIQEKNGIIFIPMEYKI
jgi:GNAT superfamily N-acetyltransferase